MSRKSTMPLHFILIGERLTATGHPGAWHRNLIATFSNTRNW